MNLSKYQREYLEDAARGYLNGFNDMGAEYYPPLTLNELIEYTWETIAYERDEDPRAKAIYFKGKKAVFTMISIIIRHDADFKNVVTDW